jgi:hypothetical protein
LRGRAESEAVARGSVTFGWRGPDIVLADSICRSSVADACKHGIDSLLAAQQIADGILFGLELVRRRLEVILGCDQRVIEFVVRVLQIGQTALVGGLHHLVAVILRRNDAVLEDHIDRRESDPTEENQRKPRQGGLQCRSEREKLNLAAAANVNLALRKGRMEPSPCTFQERFDHASASFMGGFYAVPG